MMVYSQYIHKLEICSSPVTITPSNLLIYLLIGYKLSLPQN